jgi:DNA polymerase-3 subunit gamma/tau
MTYQVLARKWRPREFSSLIGQQAVVTALTNTLREGRIAQAYLFSGIRGVGKTTAARLFAKALNCEKGPELGPCNECATCREITAGGDLDVLEIDAATYSKVEQVRELAESLKYGPTRDRYKVVVLDEVHRLSRQAFDALLKIVEEPPPRLVFIFATTEIDAVPATILSRCQEYHFRRVAATEVATHLAEICAAEKIRASEHALRLLARAGEGSVRDSVALLDQLATFGNGEISETEAARLVGGLDLALFGRLLAAILAGDSRAVSDMAREVEAQGWDPRQVHSHFLGYCRDALHLALGGDSATTELPAEEAALLAATARQAGYENLLRLLHHLLASEASVRRSEAAGLALELAWLKAAELPKLLRIEELLGDGFATPRATGSPAAQRSPVAPVAPVAPAESAPRSARPAEPPRAQPVAARPADAPSPPAPAAPAIVAPPSGDGVTRFREELSARRPTLAAGLDGADLRFAGGELHIGLSDEDSSARAQVERPSNRELIDAAVAAAFGAGVKWHLVDAPSAGARPAKPKGEAAAERSPIVADPRVQAVLDIFGGSVASAAAPAEANDADAGEATAPPRAANDPGVARELRDPHDPIEENEEPE